VPCRLVFSLRSSVRLKLSLKAALQNETNTEKGKTWKLRHAERYHRLGVVENSASLWTARKQLVGVSPLPRVRSLIDFVYANETISAAGGKKGAYNLTKTPPPAQVVVDYSQDISRGSWQVGGVPCLTRKSTLYSFDHDRALFSVEHLMLLGHSFQDLTVTGISQFALGDLAGESMTVYNLAAVLVALLSSVDFPRVSFASFGGSGSGGQDGDEELLLLDSQVQVQDAQGQDFQLGDGVPIFSEELGLVAGAARGARGGQGQGGQGEEPDSFFGEGEGEGNGP
jgi:hypothetical protein